MKEKPETLVYPFEDAPAVDVVSCRVEAWRTLAVEVATLPKGPVRKRGLAMLDRLAATIDTPPRGELKVIDPRPSQPDAPRKSGRKPAQPS